MEVSYWNILLNNNQESDDTDSIGVCILDEWLETNFLLNIAKHNRLRVTVFAVSSGEQFSLRFLCPDSGEIHFDMNGTFATSWILLNKKDVSCVSIQLKQTNQILWASSIASTHSVELLLPESAAKALDLQDAIDPSTSKICCKDLQIFCKGIIFVR